MCFGASFKSLVPSFEQHFLSFSVEISNAQLVELRRRYCCTGHEAQSTQHSTQHSRAEQSSWVKTIRVRTWRWSAKVWKKTKMLNEQQISRIKNWIQIYARNKPKIKKSMPGLPLKIRPFEKNAVMKSPIVGDYSISLNTWQDNLSPCN